MQENVFVFLCSWWSVESPGKWMSILMCVFRLWPGVRKVRKLSQWDSAAYCQCKNSEVAWNCLHPQCVGPVHTTQSFRGNKFFCQEGTEPKLKCWQQKKKNVASVCAACLEQKMCQNVCEVQFENLFKPRYRRLCCGCCISIETNKFYSSRHNWNQLNLFPPLEMFSICLCGRCGPGQSLSGVHSHLYTSVTVDTPPWSHSMCKSRSLDWWHCWRRKIFWNSPRVFQWGTPR